MYTTYAVILNTNKVGEADEIVSLYTKDFGKLVAKAKSSKKVTTKQGNFFHAVGIIQCSLVLGRGGYIISGVSEKKICSKTNSDFRAMGHLISFFRTVDSLVFENQKDIKIWKLLNVALSTTNKILSQKSLNFEFWTAQRGWIAELLNILGLSIVELNLDSIDSKAQLDYQLKKVFENRFDTSLEFFN